MIIQNELKKLSEDRIKLLFDTSKQILKEIDNIISKQNYSLFEVLFILTIALHTFLESLGKQAIVFFGDIYNEYIIYKEHKESKLN